MSARYPTANGSDKRNHHNNNNKKNKNAKEKEKEMSTKGTNSRNSQSGDASARNTRGRENGNGNGNGFIVGNGANGANGKAKVIEDEKQESDSLQTMSTTFSLIETFPEALLLHIFQFLPFTEVSSIAPVHRDWNNACNNVWLWAYWFVLAYPIPTQPEFIEDDENSEGATSSSSSASSLWTYQNQHEVIASILDISKYSWRSLARERNLIKSWSRMLCERTLPPSISTPTFTPKSKHSSPTTPTFSPLVSSVNSKDLDNVGSPSTSAMGFPRTPLPKESISSLLSLDRNYSPLSSLLKMAAFSGSLSTSNSRIQPLVFPYPRTTVSCVRFDENRLIIAESQSLRVFSLASHSQSSSRPQLAHIRIPGHMPTTVDFTSSILVSGGRDSTLRWYDWDTNELVHTSARKANHTDTVSSLYYQRKSNCIFSCGLDGLVKQWNAQTGQCLDTFTGHNFYRNNTTVDNFWRHGSHWLCIKSVNNHCAVTGGYSVIPMISNPQDINNTNTNTNNNNNNNNIRNNDPGGANISHRGRLAIWDSRLKDGLVSSVELSCALISSVSYSKGNFALAAGGSDGLVHVYDVRYLDASVPLVVYPSGLPSVHNSPLSTSYVEPPSFALSRAPIISVHLDTTRLLACSANALNVFSASPCMLGNKYPNHPIPFFQKVHSFTAEMASSYSTSEIGNISNPQSSAPGLSTGTFELQTVAFDKYTGTAVACSDCTLVWKNAEPSSAFQSFGITEEFATSLSNSSGMLSQFSLDVESGLPGDISAHTTNSRPRKEHAYRNPSRHMKGVRTR